MSRFLLTTTFSPVRSALRAAVAGLVEERGAGEGEDGGIHGAQREILLVAVSRRGLRIVAGDGSVLGDLAVP